MNLAQRRLFMVGALLVGSGALAWVSMGTLGDNLVYYWSPAEMQAKGDDAIDATVRLGGMVVPGSVKWEPEAQRLAFQVSDGTATVDVVGEGAPPQMFREGIGVVVEGRLGADGKFRSDEVMVKHSNEYRAPEAGERPEDVYKSLLVEDGT